MPKEIVKVRSSGRLVVASVATLALSTNASKQQF